MSQLEPTTQAFIDSLAGATPIYTLSPEAARNVLAGAQKSVSVKLAPARSEDRVLNVGPKGRTDIRIYRPENAKGHAARGDLHPWRRLGARRPRDA